MKKICFAIGLLPFAACVVEPDDDEGSANTEGVETEGTNPSTTNPSTSTTDDTMTSTTDQPTTGETDEPGTTGEPGGLGQCDTVCSTYMDCCEAQGVSPENCSEEGIGGYACENTECLVLGCADDTECQEYLSNDAAVCNDAGSCIIGCETLDDCEMIAMGVYDACDPDLGCIAEAEPFDCNETECPAGVCDTETGACVECLEDADCADSDYGPYCDTEINLCACMNDDDCAFELDACEL